MTDEKKETVEENTFNSIVNDLKSCKKIKEDSNCTLESFLTTFFAPMIEMDDTRLSNLFGTDEFMHCIETAKLLKRIIAENNISIVKKNNTSVDFEKFLSFIKQSGGKVEF